MIHVRWERLISCHERWLLMKHGFTTLSQKQNGNRWCGITWAAYARGGFKQLRQLKKWWQLSSGIWKEQPSLLRYSYPAMTWKPNVSSLNMKRKWKTSFSSMRKQDLTPTYKQCKPWTVLPHPPYSPDLVLSDLCLVQWRMLFTDRSSGITMIISSNKMAPTHFKSNFYHQGIQALTSKWVKATEKSRVLKESVCKWSMNYMSSFQQFPVWRKTSEWSSYIRPPDLTLNIPDTTPMWAWKQWYGYTMHDLPILLLNKGDSVEMSHRATMPFVKLPAIIL